MRTCPKCTVELVVVSIPTGRAVRCAACGAVDYASIGTGRAAVVSLGWWSLLAGGLTLLSAGFAIGLLVLEKWELGLAACLLAFVTGWLATYFGILGLVRMRYRCVATRQKLAAWTGVLTGSGIGVVLAGLTLFVGSLVYLVVRNSQDVRGVEASRQIYAQVLTMDFPESAMIEPVRVLKTPLNLGVVQFRNHADKKQASVMVEAHCFPQFATYNRGQFMRLLTDEIDDIVPAGRRTEVNRKELEWTIGEHNVPITLVTWLTRPEKKTQNVTRKDAPNPGGNLGVSADRQFNSDEASPDYPAQTDNISTVFPDAELNMEIEQELHHYYCIFDYDGTRVAGISLIHDPAVSGLDESLVRQIFQSFRLP